MWMKSQGERTTNVPSVLIEASLGDETLTRVNMQVTQWIPSKNTAKHAFTTPLSWTCTSKRPLPQDLLLQGYVPYPLKDLFGCSCPFVGHLQEDVTL